MDFFCVTGASGFIGSHLVSSLVSRPQTIVRVLSRARAKSPQDEIPQVLSFKGDLRDIGSLRAFLKRDATVIHLAQFPGASMTEQVAMAQNLAQACLETGVRRFLYISTATVVGRTRTERVTEDTPCHPANEYEQKKFAIEVLLREKLSPQIDYGILRPTAVFGAGGLNLIKIARNLEYAPKLLQILRRALYGYRSMNLVSLENVIAAIEFLATSPKLLNGNIFLLSDDEEPKNNYRDVELVIGRVLSDAPIASTPALPSVVLKVVLSLSGRSQTNPRIKYANAKLRAWGFEPVIGLEPALVRFAEWYKAQPKSLTEGGKL